MNKNDDIPYGLLANGCRYFPEEAEQDRREGRQQQPNTCAACYQPLLFILAFFKFYNGIERRVSSHFKHRPGDLEACAGYAQLRRFTSCLSALVKNARNANVNFVLECESADCVEDVPPPYVIAFREVNGIYQDAFNDAFDDTFNDTYGGASDTAIKNKTFRIKAKTNCSLFNHSRCQRCDTRHIEKLARQLAEQEEANKREEQEAAARIVREEQLRAWKAEEAAERYARGAEQLRIMEKERQEWVEQIRQKENDALAAAKIKQRAVDALNTEKRAQKAAAVVADHTVAMNNKLKREENQKRITREENQKRSDDVYRKSHAGYTQEEERLLSIFTPDLTDEETHSLRKQVTGFTGKKLARGDPEIFPLDLNCVDLRERRQYRKLLFRKPNHPTPCIGCGTPIPRVIALFPFDTDSPYLWCRACV